MKSKTSRRHSTCLMLMEAVSGKAAAARLWGVSFSYLVFTGSYEHICGLKYHAMFYIRLMRLWMFNSGASLLVNVLNSGCIMAYVPFLKTAENDTNNFLLFKITKSITHAIMLLLPQPSRKYLQRRTKGSHEETWIRPNR